MDSQCMTPALKMGAVVRLCLILAVLSYCGTQGQVISQPDDITICEGGGAAFTCVLDITDDDDDDVQWYRLINDTSTTEIVDPNGENINFMTVTMENNVTSSSLTITNARISYTGYFWVGTSSLNVCNASLTVGTSPSALTVNIMKNIESSSIVLQWDAVDDFLPTINTIIWISERNIFQVATLIEQTSYTITGLTVNTVYNIAIVAANMCGSGPEFRVSILVSTDDTSTANTNSIISTTNHSSTTTIAVTINPTMATTVSTAIATNSTTNPVGTITANETSNCNAAIIAGTTIGGILVVIIIVLILFITIYCFRRRKNDDTLNKNIPMDANHKHRKPDSEAHQTSEGFPHRYISLEQAPQKEYPEVQLATVCYSELEEHRPLSYAQVQHQPRSGNKPVNGAPPVEYKEVWHQ